MTTSKSIQTKSRQARLKTFLLITSIIAACSTLATFPSTGRAAPIGGGGDTTKVYCLKPLPYWKDTLSVMTVPDPVLKPRCSGPTPLVTYNGGDPQRTVGKAVPEKVNAPLRGGNQAIEDKQPGCILRPGQPPFGNCGKPGTPQQ